MVSAVLSMLLLTIALVLVISIVYYTWCNGISPLPSSLLLRRQVEQEVNRLSTVQQESGRYGFTGETANAVPSAMHSFRVESISTAADGAEATGRKSIHRRETGKSDGPLIIEAGSGWGTMALHLARYCQPCRVVGIENSVVPLMVSRLLAGLPGSHSIKLVHGDMYRYHYEQADLIVCYLFPGAMTRLSPIFREQTRPGTYIISVYFALPDWEAEQVITCRDVHRTRIYIYRTGSRIYNV
ncbi:class I SAM-dependent methyltransferase [Paenibacillus dauci]|uniref:class I SAM-dependent methyltransferase n=1 Tax=Paenibacillus dauci TaxID=1567106 RepID=UPI000619965A|nr:class I SAM-dependent methyltransferase [Paenibacillus dauci]